jgi:ribose transport system ATP-binding protein
MSHDETVRLMVGRDLTEEAARDKAVQSSAGGVALRVQGLCRGFVRDVSFDARRGEILGFAGLMGSGRTETMRAIFGADRKESGTVLLRRNRPGSEDPGLADVGIRSPRDAVRLGIALLTEDRKTQGLLLPLEIAWNTTLPRMSAVARLGGWIDRGKENAVATEYRQALSLRCRDVHQRVGELSGGNQQKVVLAKWLLRDCDVLIFDEPTRGIDVGAKFEIYQLLAELASRGKAVIVVSSDLLELTAIADRIAVMSAGRLVKTFNRGAWTQELIMEAALSGFAKTQAAESA